MSASAVQQSNDLSRAVHRKRINNRSVACDHQRAAPSIERQVQLRLIKKSSAHALKRGMQTGHLTRLHLSDGASPSSTFGGCTTQPSRSVHQQPGPNNTFVGPALDITPSNLELGAFEALSPLPSDDWQLLEELLCRGSEQVSGTDKH